MAETYGVYDLRALPLQTVAVLAQGLRPDARIMQILMRQQKKSDTIAFDTPEAFLAARARLVEDTNNA